MQNAANTLERRDSSSSWRIPQEWTRYRPEDHEVWRLLYERRMSDLQQHGSSVYLQGAVKIGLRADAVPDLNGVNARLGKLTGWRAIGVTGFIPADEFFACLATREFPTTLSVRPKEQLDYLPEPDIFHDVFGHVPLHSDPVFAGFLHKFGQVASRVSGTADVTRMARLFWFTVEFGLIQERGEVKVYGSGLISSHADCRNALSARCDRRSFSLDAVLEEPFEIDHVQDVLFVLDSYEQLFEAVEEAGRRLRVL